MLGLILIIAIVVMVTIYCKTSKKRTNVNKVILKYTQGASEEVSHCMTNVIKFACVHVQLSHGVLIAIDDNDYFQLFIGQHLSVFCYNHLKPLAKCNSHYPAIAMCLSTSGC